MPNQKTHECESVGFLVLYNYYSIFLWSVPSQKWCFKKRNFSFFFQNVIWPGFLAKQKSGRKKNKHPKKFISFGGSMQEAQIKWCPLTPSPTSGNWSCYLRANERPWKKVHLTEQTERQTDRQIRRLYDWFSENISIFNQFHTWTYQPVKIEFPANLSMLNFGQKF